MTFLPNTTYRRPPKEIKTSTTQAYLYTCVQVLAISDRGGGCKPEPQKFPSSVSTINRQGCLMRSVRRPNASFTYSNALGLEDLQVAASTKRLVVALKVCWRDQQLSRPLLVLFGARLRTPFPMMRA
jgi:hypothetical protein